MTRQLYIAWQSHESRTWHTVGLLTYSEQSGYVFQYVRGALDAQKEDGFSGISAFPSFDEVYQSDHLFSFFSNRILSPSRPEYQELIRQVDLLPVGDTESPDYVFDFLRRTRGWRATDSFEMFSPVQQFEGGYRWDFFTRGVRHIDEALKEKWINEAPLEPLRPVLDCHNEHDPTAVIIMDRGHRPLGFVPGNYSSTIYDIVEHADDIQLTILQHNRDAQLDEKRFLLEMKASMPTDFHLPTSSELEPLVDIGENAA